jgi:hypothetical protein
MKRLGIFLLIFFPLISCVEMTKKECIDGYLKADDWLIERTRLAGNNKEAKDAIYQEYLNKYKELDLKCK